MEDNESDTVQGNQRHQWSVKIKMKFKLRDFRDLKIQSIIWFGFILHSNLMAKTVDLIHSGFSPL